MDVISLGWGISFLDFRVEVEVEVEGLKIYVCTRYVLCCNAGLKVASGWMGTSRI